MFRTSLALLWESLRLASDALRTDKLRTALSLSGVVIGIFTIIGVLAAVDSLRRDIRRSLNSLGNDIVFVDKWPWSDMGGDYPWWKYLSRPMPSLQEAEEIRRRMPEARHVVFRAEASGKAEFQGVEVDNINLQGITQDYTHLWEVRLEAGRFISEPEFRSGSPVAVLGNTVAQKLFGGKNAVDRMLRFKGRQIRVVGVLAREGRSFVGSMNDEDIFVPLNFFRTLYDLKDPDLFTQIAVKPRENVPLALVREELIGVVRAIRRIRPGAEENFAVNQIDMLVRQTASIFAVLNLVAAIIGGISIFIGGFGVANILFVSVKERTQQIGIQKALGATPSFIQGQFLLEAVLLSLAGCLAGLTMVWIAARVATIVLNFPLTLSFQNVALGMLISVVTGLVAGLWPARAAARLHPAEAIRSR